MKLNQLTRPGFPVFNAPPGRQPTTVAEAIPALQAAFEEYRERSDQRVERLTNLVETVSRNQANAIIGGGGQLPADNEAQARTFFGAVLHREPMPDEIDHAALRDYRPAFAAMLRRGNALSGDIMAALSIGSDPDGGFFAPPEVSQQVLERSFETSTVRRLARVVDISASALEFPIAPNDAISGGWVGERQARPGTSTEKFGTQRIEVHEQYANPQLTQSLIDDAAFPVEDWYAGRVADKLGRTENTAYVNGDGVMQPRGFMSYAADAVTTDDAGRNWGVLQYVPSGASGGFPTLSGVPGASDPDALINLMHKLKPEFRANAVWAMNRETAGVVRKLKDGDGRYLWMESLTEGGRPILLGHPVEFLEDMPDVGSDAFAIAFGDFMAGYLIVDRLGIRVIRDAVTNKPYVGLYTIKRTGGDVVNFDAIKLLKFATS